MHWHRNSVEAQGPASSNLDIIGRGWRVTLGGVYVQGSDESGDESPFLSQTSSGREMELEYSIKRRRRTEVSDNAGAAW